jgi:hypothetical protein
LFHVPQKLYKLDGFFRISKHVLAARESVVHMVQTALDQYSPPAWHPGPFADTLPQHC